MYFNILHITLGQRDTLYSKWKNVVGGLKSQMSGLKIIALLLYFFILL